MKLKSYFVIINIIILIAIEPILGEKLIRNEIIQKTVFISLIVLWFNCLFFYKKYRYNLQLILLNIVMVIFYFGQCYSYILGERELYMLNYVDNSLKLLRKTCIISLKFYILFNIGLVISEKIKEKIFFSSKIFENNIKVKKVLKIFLKIAILFIFLFFIVIIQVFFKSKYSGIRELNLNYAYKILVYCFNYFMLYLILNKNNKNNKKYKRMFLLFSFLLFFLGSRSFAVANILVYIFFVKYIEYQKFKLKEYFIFLLMIFMIPILAYIRVGETIKKLTISNLIIDVLKELGFTIIPTMITIKNVPMVRGYEYGRTLYEWIIRIIPFSDKYYTFLKYGSVWVSEVRKSSFGLGFSLVAEGYLNFGENIWIFAIISGVIIGYFVVLRDNAKLEEKYLFLISIHWIYFSIRSDFSYIMLNLFNNVFLFIIFYKILLKITKRF